MKKKIRIKKNFTQSQKQWLERHMNDPYVQKAAKEGYRSRAAYKLIEIQDKFKLFKKNQRILDLGAAPGSWSQVIQQYISKTGEIIGIDLLSIKPIPGIKFIQDDFYNIDQHIKGLLFDGILSDLAPSTCGIQKADHLKLIGMIEDIIYLLPTILKTDGFFVCKVFKGGIQKDLLDILKKNFKSIKHFKPKASREKSPEEYLIAQNFKITIHQE